MQTPFQFENSEIRSKYLKLAQAEGLDKAVTALHNLIGQLEPRMYDGGYAPERLEKVEFLRSLTRELWAMRLDPNVKK